SAAGGVGTLGGGIAGEPSVVSGVELLSLAARQPVVVGRAYLHPGYLRLPHRAGEVQQFLSGPTHVCYGATHGRGPGADLQGAACCPGSRPLAGGPTSATQATIAGSGPRPARGTGR